MITIGQMNKTIDMHYVDGCSVEELYGVVASELNLDNQYDINLLRELCIAKIKLGF